MTEHGAQYDHIGSKYDEYAQTATLKRAESYTVLRMVGPLAGKRVLDLASRGALRRLHGQPGVYPQQAQRLPIRELLCAPDTGGGPVRLRRDMGHRASYPLSVLPVESGSA